MPSVTMFPLPATSGMFLASIVVLVAYLMVTKTDVDAELT
jgi:hypothetical protein